MKIHVYNDPGHGWASVPMSLLVDLGIDNKVSTYSYQRGKRVGSGGKPASGAKVRK